MIFQAAILVAGVVAGAVASIAGFGIGSLLTPLFAVRMGTSLAVAVACRIFLERRMLARAASG